MLTSMTGGAFQAFRFQKRAFQNVSVGRAEVDAKPGQPEVNANASLMSSPDRIDVRQESLNVTPYKSAPAAAASLQDSPGNKPSPSADRLGSQPERSRKRKSPASQQVEEFEEGLSGLPERLGNKPLRLIIVGTNPSGHAWRSGHYYSNPSNHMWRILKAAEIAPSHIRGAEDDVLMPDDAGVGFLDVGCGHPGTHLAKFSSGTIQSWASAFYARLAAFRDRANEHVKCCCGGGCGEPKVVAFAGKRQWMELMNIGRVGKSRLTKVDGGIQSVRPQGWPFSSKCEVWIMPSTSGAAAMTTQERLQPYLELGRRLKTVPNILELAHGSYGHNCQCSDKHS